MLTPDQSSLSIILHTPDHLYNGIYSPCWICTKVKQSYTGRQCDMVRDGLQCTQCPFSLCKNKPLTFDPKVFDGEDVLHLWYVSPAVKLFQAPVPLVHNWPLGAAGQDQVGFAGNLQIFNIGVSEPRVKWLVGVEPIAVPFVHRCGAGLQEKQLSVQLSTW